MSKLRLRAINSINVSTHAKHYNNNVNMLHLSWKHMYLQTILLNNKLNQHYVFATKDNFSTINDIKNKDSIIGENDIPFEDIIITYNVKQRVFGLHKYNKELHCINNSNNYNLKYICLNNITKYYITSITTQELYLLNNKQSSLFKKEIKDDISNNKNNNAAQKKLNKLNSNTNCYINCESLMYMKYPIEFNNTKML